MSAIYGAIAGEKVNVSLYNDTGYRVDHVPFLSSYVDNLTPAIAQTGLFISNHVGIGVIRVSCPGDYAQYIDYCKIDLNQRILMSGSDTASGTVSPLHPSSDPDGGLTWQDITSNGITSAYYFITGYSVLNSGVVEFTIMLDAWTTLRAIGATLASAGGMLTRCPVYDSEEYNTLQEPYTPQYPYTHTVTEMDIDEKNEYAYNDGGDYLLEETGSITVLMSPYKLPQGTHDADDTLTVEYTATSDAEQGTKTVIQYPAATPASTYTVFNISDQLSSSYKGIRAYNGGDANCMQMVSKLFAANISNVVMDAYIIPTGVQFVNALNTRPNTITGKRMLKTYTPKSVTYNTTDKSTYINRWITIFFPSSGETQTCALYDLELDNDGNVQIDVWTDPMPSGGFYARMRQKGENLATKVKPGLPGAIKSKEWRKATIALTLNGQGVEQGQTWKSAELGIEAAVANAQAASTAAQYDMGVGNGYLLNAAGNQYGLKQLKETMRYAQANYNNANFNQNANAVASAAGMLGGAFSWTKDKDIQGGGYASYNSGAVTGAFQSIIAGQQAQIDRNESLLNLANSSQINSQQMMDQGQYNIQLLSAQQNAATAVANAAVEKIGLQSAKLSKCPETTVMGYEKTGMLQANPTTFYVIETRMDTRDVEGLKKSLQMFGETVYLEPSVAETHLEASASSGKWNFVQITGMGQEFLAGLTKTVPAWLRKGFCDQLANGMWIYKE